ncbi:unnamed protein product [Phytomonas sp. EM1]|nr:unnamed protein product [Phytomonas sp. EM1]|eukprot:CCW59981.1 unnamed protein product [Phytomonas sp. isolate EM1]
MSFFRNLLIAIGLVAIVLSMDAFGNDQVELLGRESSQENVYILPGILPFSEKVPPLPWLGHWVYGDSPEAEAAFFQAEDEQHELWTQWRKVLSDWEGEVRGDDARKGKNIDNRFTAQMDFFKIPTMRQRYSVYKSLLADGSNPNEAKGLKLLMAVKRFGKAIQNNSLSLLAGDPLQTSSSAAHIIHALATKCFDHTTCDPYASKMKCLWSFLPSHLLYNTDILYKALHEEKMLQRVLVALYKNTNRSTGMGAWHDRDAIEMNTTQAMQHITDYLQRSQSAVQAIYSLSLPLYSLAVSQVNLEIERIKKLLINNDGSNQAQEAQMKFLTKRLSRLKEWANDLVESYSYIQKTKRNEKLSKGTGKPENVPEQVLMVSLTLISIYRLNCNAGLPALEVLPSPTTGILTRLTGLVSSDITWKFGAIACYLLFLGFVLYLFIGVKWWALKAAVSSAPSYRSANVKRSTKNKIYRFLFMSLRTGEAWAPLLLLAWGYAMWKFSGATSPMLLFACMRPSQRVVVCLLALSALGISKSLCIRLSMLPNCIAGPPRYQYARKNN